MAVLSEGASPDAASTGQHSFGELPKIISVDDHVVEPPHLWQTWLPAKFREQGPRVERRGIGEMQHIGGGAYRQTFDPDGPQADCWIYEDLVYIHKRHVAAVGFDRDEMTMSPITYDEMRAGCYDPKARIEDMDLNCVDGVAVVPDLPAVLRADLRRGEGQGARDGLRARLQRLDGRGVVRRLRRQADPARDHPAVGRRRRGRGGAAQRRPRLPRRLLQRDPAAPRPAEHPQRVLGPAVPGVRGDQTRSSACTSGPRRGCRRRRATRRWRWPPR